MTVVEIWTALQRVAEVVRRVVGVPDYQRYLRHVRTCHPAQAPMSREDFERLRLEDKYSRPGQRCC
jgi:uncharacterized short protein YbdD (DUF466 family)